jgi:hypothetical protein
VLEFSFNPGLWNIKEHDLDFIMANVASSLPYLMITIVVIELFYDIKLDYWFKLVLVVGTDFSFAGLRHQPASMVWLQTCILVHTVLYHGRSLWNGIKRIKVEPDDIHTKLMRNYPEVPDWWYIIVFVLFFSLTIIAVKVSFCFFFSPVNLGAESADDDRFGIRVSLCGRSYSRCCSR